MTAKKRSLGLIDAFAIGVNAIVGSGVFSAPTKMHRVMGGASPLAYVLCAIVLMPVALCFAELAASNDSTGGPYLYATKAFGRKVGFIVGWSAWLNAFISWAANTTLFVKLVGVENPVVAHLVCVGAILVLGAINYVGVRPGASVIQAVVFGKVTAILCFIGFAIAAAHPGSLGGPLPHGIAGVGSGVYFALFPFQGFEVVPVPAGETKNPERNMPLATIASLLFAALLYVVVQSLLELSYPDLATTKSETPLVDAARFISPSAGTIVFIGSIVSIGGFTAGSALGAPRYASAIGAQDQISGHLAKTHPRFQTPHVAIVVTTLLAAVLTIPFDYEVLVGFSNITVVIQYALSCAAVPVLRRQRAQRGEPPPKGFRVPFGMVLPIFGGVGSIVLLYGSDWKEVLWCAGGLALGVLVANARAFLPRSARG
ncbi:MAG: amino acid permease [Polyangiaceae bacterium]